ncbi:MAG: MFS transporter [Epulopiscium sp. Nele67-Bin004]|nr:MAG: MFS transporter [Epulopiscium sp. Nele67-Bin004]
MRRKDREVTNINEIYKVIDECNCCRVGFIDEGQVYIVPLSFGYTVDSDVITLYFHSAMTGRKIDLAKKKPNVGFEMDCGQQLQTGEVACDYSTNFKSVIGNGEISIVDNKEEKILALQKLMQQHTSKSDWEFDTKMLDVTCILKLVVSNISCKCKL